MEAWIPVAVPLFATFLKPSNPMVMQVLGYGVESGLPLLVMCSPAADWVQAGHANFAQSRAHYWSAAAHERLGGLVLHPTQEQAYEVARRKVDAIREQGRQAVREAEEILGGVR